MEAQSVQSMVCMACGLRQPSGGAFMPFLPPRLLCSINPHLKPAVSLIRQFS